MVLIRFRFMRSYPDDRALIDFKPKGNQEFCII